MKKSFVGACFFLLIFCTHFVVAAQTARPLNQTRWNPQKTWVFFVGLLEWKDKKTFGAFPKTNRRDEILLDVLRSRGVPENQIVYLQDKQATTAQIQNSFNALLRQAQPDDWVFVYFCGHGFKNENRETFLASYDATDETGWKVSDIPDAIDNFFKGSNALIMLDNCYSGAMAETVTNRRSRVSYAVLASTHFNSFSTANWTFTESLIYAFRGDSFVDQNADGKITLGELAEDSAEDLLFAEEQIAEFALTGKLNRQTIIAENAVKTAPRLGERVEAFDGEDWYRAIITDVRHGEYKVHYFGYEYDEDAFRSENQIRRFAPKQFKIGASVEAESDGKWYPAKILDVKGGAHLVAYDDYDAEWNEWISSDRLRRRK